MIADAGLSCDATFDAVAGTVTLVHSGLASKKHKRDASPRVIPLGAIESIEFSKPALMKRGYVRFVLRGRSGYHPDVIEDVNGYLLKGTDGTSAELFVDAVRAALVHASPVEGYGAAGTPEETRPGLLERSQRYAARWDDRTAQSFGALRIRNDHLTYRGQSFPVEGATARIESAGIAKTRMTATRVIGGTALLGGVGAVVGALGRKDTSTIFLTVELSDGTVIVEECPLSREGDARRFAAYLSKVARPREPRTDSTSAPAQPGTHTAPPPAPAPQNPPPGWYCDPQGGLDVRWWNGVDWTGHVRPAGDR